MKELPQAKLKRKSKSKLSIVHKRVQRSTELNPTDVGDSIVWCLSCVILETLLNLSVPQQPHHCKTVVITTLARGAWWRLNGNSQKAPTSQVRNKSSWTCVSCLHPSLYFLSSLTLLLPHFFKFSKCDSTTFVIKKYINMSNGTISLQITLLIKFKGKRLQLNKKYLHSLGQHILISLLSSGGGVLKWGKGANQRRTVWFCLF